MTPYITDPWLGPLTLRGNELIGAIDVPGAIRRPRDNGRTDCEVVLRFGDPSLISNVESEVSQGSAAIHAALANLEEIKVFGLAHAPRDWLNYYTAVAREPLVERLFLDSFAVDRQMTVETWFDFGDLDALVVRSRDGEGLAVRFGR